MAIAKEPFSLRECIENAVTLLAPQAHQNGLELVSMVYGDVPDNVIGDALCLGQVLTTLLSNAVQYTPSGEVIFRAMLEEQFDEHVIVTFSVTDTGIGIPSVVQQRLFSQFRQTSTEYGRDYDRSRSDLRTCHFLAKAMGGEINASSVPGKGSCFRVTVALQIDHLRRPIVAPQYPGHSVVLIEPHKLARISLRNTLEQLALHVTDYPALVVGDLAERKPDVVVIGSASDEPSIEHLVIQIELTRARYPCAVLALLSSSDQSLLQPVIAAGAARTLCKPIRMATLLDALDVIFNTPQDRRNHARAQTEQGAAPRRLTEDIALIANNQCIRDEDFALKIAGGSRHIANQLLDALLVELPVHIEEFHAACCSEDWQLLREETHRLRGATAVCGVSALQVAIDELNAAACRRSRRASAQALAELQQQVDRLAELTHNS